MKTAYFDCFSGISGDMCLGALLDTGVSSKVLLAGLKKIPVKNYDITVKKVSRAGIRATAVAVQVSKKDAPARMFRDVRGLIGRSKLPGQIKEGGIAIFERMFRAEAKVHGGRYDRVHLHELGAVDAVVDVMGTLILLDELGVERIVASAINVGSGTVQTAHGELPVPAPATLELLRGVPIYGSAHGFELATPTGAAILTQLAESFGPLPLLNGVRAGYGAGGKNIRTAPNVLRVLMGASPSRAAGGTLCMVETNIDDMNPQVFPFVMERMFRAGALDVWIEQIIMKKGRPAHKLSALCPALRREAVVKTMLAETTTLGVRYWDVERAELERSIRTVETPYGPIRYKDAYGAGVHRSVPEFDDVRRAAETHGIPLVDILKYLSTTSSARQRRKKSRKSP